MITGSQFLASYLSRSQLERESAAIELAKQGNYVHWPMIAVPLSSATLKGSINVASDYFAVGTPDDYFYLPLSPIAAQKIADIQGLSLPTTKIVRDTWKSALQMQPQPMRNLWIAQRINPDTRMVSLQGFADHNQQLAAAIGERNPSQLISGTKKDVVISNKIQPKKVAIYGWFDKVGQFVKPGQPIQGLNPSDHNDGYADYSHGIRFVELIVTLESGEKVGLAEPIVESLVSDEGPIKITRYNTSNDSGNQNVSLVTPVSESGAIGENILPKRDSKGWAWGVGIGLGVITGLLWWTERQDRK